MIGGGCPECGWSSLGPDACPRCGLPRSFAEAPVGPPLGERLGEWLGEARARLANLGSALRARLPAPLRALQGVALLSVVAAAWRWGPAAWAAARPHLEQAWTAARSKASELTAPAPEASPAAEVLALRVILPDGVTSTRAKIRMVSRSGVAKTLELERVDNGRYRIELPVPRDPAQPIAVAVGFGGGRPRKYRWACPPEDLGSTLHLDVARARSGEGCWNEHRE